MERKTLILLGMAFVFGIISQVPDRAHGDTLYKWVNEAGQLCFSNTRPPEINYEYKTIETGNDGDVKSKEKLQNANFVLSKENESNIAHRNDEEIQRARKRFILKRIDETKKSIEAIQQALTDRPNDSALIRSLRVKRQTLMEDFSKLQKI